MHPRARAARLGDDAEQPRHRALDARANARAAPRASKRPSPPTATRWRNSTRERVPLDWATTQNNLGNALSGARGTRERHGAPRGSRRRLPRRAGGIHPRPRAARLGDDAEQPRQRAPGARGTRERHGAAGGGRRRLPRRARGIHPRARAARMGDDAEQPRPALGRSANARAARRGSRKPSPPTAPRWRNAPASACRSTGR